MVSYFFDKSKPVNFLVINTLFALYFVLVSVQEFNNFETLSGLLLNKTKVLIVFMALFLLFNFIVTKNNLTHNNTYAFLFYVILIGLFPTVITADLHISLTITFLFLLRKIYSLKSTKNLFKKLFDAGFWIGLSFILEPFSILFFLLVYTAVIVHKKEGIQTLIIPFLGFVIPLFLYFTYCYWNDMSSEFEQLFHWQSSFNFYIYRDLNYYFQFIFIGFFVFFSVLIKTLKVFSISNSFKKNWTLLVVNLLISIGLLLFFKERDGSELLLLFFPVAIILANGIEMIQKTWIKEFILWFVLIGSFTKILF